MVTYVLENGIDIVFCQDVCVKLGKPAGVPTDWSSFSSSNDNSYILVTNMDYVAVQSLVMNNSVFIALNVFNEKLFLGSQYSAPSSDLEADLEEWSNVFPEFSKVLVAGDFNAHLLSLGYSRQDPRGQGLVDQLMFNNMMILNDLDAPHTFVQGDLTGRPDLTIGGTFIQEIIDDWHVDINRFSFSDHRYINFKLNINPVYKNQYRYKTKNGNFKKFDMLFKGKLSIWNGFLGNIQTTDDIDNFMEKFIEDVGNIMERSFRKKT